MRDFRDAKAMAQTIRAALAAKGQKISISESLELIAKAFGAADWNTLSAGIQDAGSKPPPPTPAPAQIAKAFGAPDWEALEARSRAAPIPPRLRPATGIDPNRPIRLSPALEATLRNAVASASARRQSFATLEHVLLALLDDDDAPLALEACGVDLARLRLSLTGYLDTELAELVQDQHIEPSPTAGLNRVIQRAVIHVRSSGRDTVTGANVLVAIFSEDESHACYVLREQQMTRHDAVNFIAHGIRKDDAAA
jgi:hypothetical protein